MDKRKKYSLSNELRREFDDCVLDIQQLQDLLSTQNRAVYQRVDPLLNKLNNAIKISELDVKFGRTPAILQGLLKILEEEPGNEVLIAVVGETALLSRDKTLAYKAEKAIGNTWRTSNYSSLNLIRIICELSAYTQEYSTLQKLVTFCPEAEKETVEKGIRYLLSKIQSNNLLSELENAPPSMILSELAKTSAPAKNGTVQLDSEQSVLKSDSFQILGRVIRFIRESGFGIILGENGKYYRFLERNQSPNDSIQITINSDVLFHETEVFSRKENSYQDAAIDITVVRQGVDPEHRYTGYIVFYSGNQGYLVKEEEYPENTKGDIQFNQDDFQTPPSLDTRAHHYRVTYLLATDQLNRARDIIIEEEVSKPFRTVTTVPKQSTGYIVFYHSAGGYGYIEPVESYKPNQKRGSVYFRSDSLQDELDPNTFLYHYEVSYYVTRSNDGKFMARDIQWIRTVPIVQSEHREIGYIVHYSSVYGMGYIVDENDYPQKKKGNIRFRESELQGARGIDTYQYHYKVSFVRRKGGHGYQDSAFGIVVLETLSKVKAPILASVAVSHTYLETVGVREGETIFLILNNGSRYLGRYLSCEVDQVCLQVENKLLRVSYSEIQELLFCGLITDFDILSLKGMVNRKYAFRDSNVMDSRLKSNLKEGKYSSYLCTFSLLMDEDRVYINRIDTFQEEMLSRLPWQEGLVSGLYDSEEHFFSVNQTVRCYVSGVKDPTMVYYLQEKDFLEQKVFFRSVFHKTVDSRRPASLSESVVDIRGAHQLGILNHTGDGDFVQCNQFVYPVESSLRGLDSGTDGLVELCCVNSYTLMAGIIQPETTALPSQKDRINQEKAHFDRLTRQAAQDQDYDLQIKLNQEFLNRGILNPRMTLGILFKVCIKNGRLDIFRRIMEENGYMLQNSFRYGLMMQLEYLEGQKDEAAEIARRYFHSSGAYDTMTRSFATAILQDKPDERTLIRHILNDSPFSVNRFSGRIGYFNPNTKAGYIEWDQKKLNFSWRDVENYDPAGYNVTVKEYTVTFHLDISASMARDVKVVKSTLKPSAFQEEEIDELELEGEATMTKLLSLRREQYRLGNIREFLADKYKNYIRDDHFHGSLEEAEELINALTKKRPQRRVLRDTIPRNRRPELFLASAKIHAQLLPESNGGDFWSSKAGNLFLFRYALRSLTTGTIREAAEMEYYCESVFLNEFGDAQKNPLKARCIAVFFEGGSDIPVNDCHSRVQITEILNRTCTDPEGFSRLLMNLPKEVFIDLVEWSNPALLTCVRWQLVQSEERNDGDKKEIIKRFYDTYQNKLNKLKMELEGFRGVEEARANLEQLSDAETDFGQFLFPYDCQQLETVSNLMNDIVQIIEEQNVNDRVSKLLPCFASIRSLLKSIEQHPSRFTYELLHPFLTKLNKSLCRYLDSQFCTFQPELKIEHYSLSGNRLWEKLEISSPSDRLGAKHVRVERAVPYGSEPGFVVEEVRQIRGNNVSVSGKNVREFLIPVRVDPAFDGKVIELSVDVSYEYDSGIDADNGSPIPTPVHLTDVLIQIPLDATEMEPIRKSPYVFAGGGDLRPDDEDAQRLFAGRERDIEDIFHMITTQNGKLKAGSITAIYGQKRCGKTSVVRFLGSEIEKRYGDAIVLYLSAQGIEPDGFFQNLLATICSRLHIELLKKKRFKNLRNELKAKELVIPRAETIMNKQWGDAPFDFSILFYEFFQSFRAEYPDQYPIVLMVDEFTQAFTFMKQRKIRGTFLNQWRAMVQENGFVNIIVGQDFMRKFITDDDVASQNLGAAVNGLGTVTWKHLSYLDWEGARKIIEEPVRFADGSSRYRGLLGKQAIQRIYDLTGGSAFYLMKFCNALAEYMKNSGDTLIPISLVDDVLHRYAFKSGTNMIQRIDFDPIFNEYSSSDNGEKEIFSSLEELNAKAWEEAQSSYRILKEIADHSDRQGVCNTSRLDWSNHYEEKKRILRSLVSRGVLTDPHGKEINSEKVKQLDVRFKVLLFCEWLKENG